MKTKNARHSKEDPNWTTPPWLVELVRSCLGGTIALDPFSSEAANKSVKAERFFTEADDGFSKKWDADTLMINPPGLLVKKAWDKLREEIASGRANQVIWVGFSVEQLCLLAEPDTDFYPLDFSAVMLRKRISFVKEDGTTGSPSHGNYIVGLNVPHEIFAGHFRPYGRIIQGPLAL